MRSPNYTHLHFICLSVITCVNSAPSPYLQTFTLETSAFWLLIFLPFLRGAGEGLACEHFDAVDGCGPAAVLIQPFICGSPD